MAFGHQMGALRAPWGPFGPHGGPSGPLDKNKYNNSANTNTNTYIAQIEIQLWSKNKYNNWGLIRYGVVRNITIRVRWEEERIKNSKQKAFMILNEPFPLYAATKQNLHLKTMEKSNIKVISVHLSHVIRREKACSI